MGLEYILIKMNYILVILKKIKKMDLDVILLINIIIIQVILKIIYITKKDFIFLKILIFILEIFIQEIFKVKELIIFLLQNEFIKDKLKIIKKMDLEPFIFLKEYKLMEILIKIN